MKPRKKSARGSRPASLPNNRKNRLAGRIILTVILLWTIVLYYPVTGYDFFNLDDPNYIIENDRIKDLSWAGILHMFTRIQGDNYAPVTDVFMAVQHTLGGMNAGTFHLGSLLLHLVNTCLVFWCVRLLAFSAKELSRADTGWFNPHLWIASFTALLFAVHPLQTESVAWASAGSNLLYTAFFLGSLISYIYYLNDYKRTYLIVSFALFVLSVLSKPVGIGLPLILLLTDYLHGRSFRKGVVIEKIPFFIVAIAAGVMSVMFKQASGALYVGDFSWFHRVLFAAHNFIIYISKLLAPFGQSVYHPYPAVGQTGDLAMLFFIAPFLVAGLVAAAFWARRFSKTLLFGLLFFAITIFPVLQLVSQGSSFISERYVYLPCLGIFLIVATGADRIREYRTRYNFIPVVICMTWAVILSVLTVQRVRLWESSIALWTDVIEKHPDDSYGYSSRGNARSRAGDYQGALTDCNKAIQLSPDESESYFFRGNTYARLDHHADAISDYGMAIRLGYPFPDKPYYFRALMKSKSEDFSGAIADYTSAIQVSPSNPVYYLNRATARFNLADYEGAIADNSEALRLQTPFAGEAYRWRGIAQLSLNRLSLACTDFRKAQELGIAIENDLLQRACQ